MRRPSGASAAADATVVASTSIAPTSAVEARRKRRARSARKDDDRLARRRLLPLRVLRPNRELREALAVLLPLAGDFAGADDRLIGHVHAAELTGDLADATAVTEPVRDQLAERRVLEAAMDDDRPELLRLRELEVMVQRIEVAGSRRVLHELRHPGPL